MAAEAATGNREAKQKTGMKVSRMMRIKAQNIFFSCPILALAKRKYCSDALAEMKSRH
jgi:hypothetical protein